MLKKTRDIFKTNLTEMRKALFKRQADFAPLVGMELRGYQKYESGETWPQPERLDLMGQHLGCSPWQLLRDPESIPTHEKSPSSMLKVMAEQQAEIERLQADLKKAAAKPAQIIGDMSEEEILIIRKVRELGPLALNYVLHSLTADQKYAEGIMNAPSTPALQAFLRKLRGDSKKGPRK